MMTAGPRLRTRYLSLGLFAQSIVDVLITFVDKGKDENLEPCLKEALASLQAANRPPADRGNVKAFTNFEQVWTLNQIAEPKRQEAIRILEDIIHQRGSTRKLRRQAETAIEFFYTLEGQALRNFDQPTDPLPSGIRRLCNTT
jgi:hypothetical protein